MHDGTDLKIREPQPFNKKWYSHKFKGPGVRYEIGLSIRNGDIVWTSGSGGFPCGDWADIKIARELYVHYAKNEKTLENRGYIQFNRFKQPANRIEKKVFHACVNLVQVSIRNGENFLSVNLIILINIYQIFEKN